ncbi:isoleucine--tRNA ligase [Candidatus Poribacteria bacterium]|nr:isoleucine--tRNA ligase [Candidatus Poribacteria bacterium]MYB64979.1 isoleucine--tRNA ligase [Candidatus Poribacteria bacterium]MYF56871.1 isoleucine--tRNA ligase [Candidatus Poribacteria bacterium]
MFKEVSPQFTFAEKEKKTLEFWRENDIFQKSMEMYKDAPSFVFLEGPPFANAPPGVHHALARIMKDAVCRYKTMTGHYVHRKAGWDTHGLPVEYQVEKQLNISNKAELEAYGVQNFIEKCKENVFQYEQDWREMTERIGFWVNLDEAYITLSNDYIESVWWVLRQAWDKDLLYQGHKVQPYCYRCGTTLANHEVALGYQEVDDPSIYVRFPVKNKENTYLLVWTTTPWTLPSNLAVAVGEDYDYVAVEDNGQRLILGKECIPSIFEEGPPKIVDEYKGTDLLNWEYEPIFDTGTHTEKSHYIVPGEFVTTTEGSGLVHIAPAFGQDDYDIGKKHNLPFVQLVGADGKFVPDVKDVWSGEYVKDADPQIIENLNNRGLLFKATQYTHQYPFCWRCDNPLLYYARESWFIRTTAIREQMLQHNQQINWYPEHIKDGRFGNWLENNIDWGLSRERYWGTPLPVWVCDECNHQHCVGSIAELKALGEDVPEDIELHRPYIDDVVLTCEKCGGTMHRIQDVIDCWFDSGCAHTAQWHYPFENKELFEEAYPPDFISEGIDQTRGWFYSLLATGTLIHDRPAYKNCLCLELVLASDGTKMSKSRGNTVDPWSILNEQGADALRWYMFTATPPWAQRTFKIEGIDEALKKFMGTLQNVYSFFVMYANLEQVDVLQDAPPVAERATIDRWILSRLNTLINKVRDDMEKYHLTNAPRAIETFVDDLSNWYVRRSRDRFWGAEAGVDKQAAYATLYEVLVTVAKLAAPFVPFLSDELYRNLVGSLNSEAPMSVHLAGFPEADESFIDTQLETDMDFTRDVISMGHAARNRSGIKTRQPLGEITLGGLSDTEKETINRLSSYVHDELNVKEIVFTEELDTYAQVTLKPNFKVLGPKYGKGVQAIAKALAAADSMQLKAELEAKGNLQIEAAAEIYTLEQSEIDVQTQNREGFFVEVDARKFVALSTELTHALRLEGMARELVNKIQNMRKDADFNVSDRIRLRLDTQSELVAEAFETHREYILAETLTTEVVETLSEDAFTLEQKLNGELATISVEQI